MGKNGVGAAIWIALGLAVAGALVGWGFQQGRKPVRSVVVPRSIITLSVALLA